MQITPGAQGMQGRWLARYGDVLCVAIGVGMLVDGMFFQTGQQAIASTLVVLGAGVVVIGIFSTRLEGQFQFGPSGLKGTLAPLKAQEDLTDTLSHALDKLGRSAREGETTKGGHKP